MLNDGSGNVIGYAENGDHVVRKCGWFFREVRGQYEGYQVRVVDPPAATHMGLGDTVAWRTHLHHGGHHPREGSFEARGRQICAGVAWARASRGNGTHIAGHVGEQAVREYVVLEH